MLEIWLAFGLLIFPFILVCVFVWLDIRLLNLKHMIEEDISRLEQKYYYLEKLILLLTSSDNPQDVNFDELLTIITDKTDSRSNLSEYKKTKKKSGGDYEKDEKNE